MRSLAEAFRAPVFLAALLLAACGTVPQHVEQAAPVRRPVSDQPVKIGKPYQVAGKWYVPSDNRTYDEVGYASWYGGDFHGGATANGEAFDMTMISGAHKTLPLPCYVEVTALDTGRTILLRINDRGPFVANRIIDLSRRAAEQLGIARQGVARVRVRRVEPPEADRAALRGGGMAAARPDADRTTLAMLESRFRQSLTPPAPTVMAMATPSLSASAIGGWFVQVAAYADRARADSLAAALGATIESMGNVHRVRIGPYFDEAVAQAALARLHGDGYQDARLIRPVAGN